MIHLRPRTILMAGIALAIVVLCVYFYFDPSDGLFPKCTFRVITGWDCPGCGAQRALHAVLHGNFAEAWRYNAAMFVFMPLLIVWICTEFIRKKHPRFYCAVNSRTAACIVCALIAAWWIGRNIFL